MFKISRRATFGMLLLLIMPVGVWIAGWQWQPGESNSILKDLFWMTKMVTNPWGIVTSVLLSAWVLWCLRFRLKPAILLVIMNATILAGQYTKSFIKEQVQEPLPYVVWLEQHHGLDDKAFYELKRKQRGEMVTALITDENQIPGWLKRHWAFETGFAFPSGHMMFAASWALLAMVTTWLAQRFCGLLSACRRPSKKRWRSGNPDCNSP